MQVSQDHHRQQLADRLSMPPLICGENSYSPRRIPDTDIATDLPLVSIITVVRNAVATVADTVASVAAQTYAGQIEYIVIDGGSTDGTLKVLAEHEGTIDCLVSEPDEGIYDAMNKGLRLARGRYVALLNADDRLLPDFVKESVAVLEETGADISYCGWFADEKEMSTGSPDLGMLFSQQGISHNTFLHRASCFERIGGFDTDYQIIADAKWYRAAYLSGLAFARVAGSHYFFSMGGVSNASTLVQQERMIREQVRLGLSTFEMLDQEAARTIFLANFTHLVAHELCKIEARFRRSCPLLAGALAQAVRWNIRNRPIYMLQDDPGQLLNVLLLAEHFDVGLDKMNSIESPLAQSLGEMLGNLERMSTECRTKNRRICLHFAKVFSTETETFIFDLLTDMAADDPNVMHVMLCDTRINADIRPWPNVLIVAWEALEPRLQRRLYDLIWDRLSPKQVIAHFALNGWTLHQRLTRTQRTVPWVNMCHGIDVFTLTENHEYGAWVREYCALAPRLGFTVVSNFLQDLLLAQGVPPEKVTLVPNAVGPTFLEHCKSDGFWRPGRPLRVISIGRLIDWKGQGILLHAVAMLREKRPDVPVHVTFVYGREARNLEAVMTLARTLDLEDATSFVPFIDVRADPSVLADFDLLVLPSTLSKNTVPRTETFGMAILEAMAAGLPVIGTDAGGIPEVVGPEDAQTRIVPHGQAEPLAEAIAAMIDAPDEVFTSARTRAEDRTRRFSPEARLRALSIATTKANAPRKRIVHFCALNHGGAGGASLNVHRGFLRRGYDSVFVTRASIDPTPIDDLPGVVMLEPDVSIGFEYLQAAVRPGFTIFSVDEESISDAALRKVVESADLINLTWTARFLSAGNIAMLSRLGVPVVITLRDMHMITGGCHYFHGCDGWQSGCANCPQADVDPELGHAGLTFQARAKSWNHKAITFAALSDHSTEILKQSPLTSSERCIKLPNYIETKTFYPDPSPLPDDMPSVRRIGYLPSFGSRVKGHAELISAMRRLHARRPDLQVVLVMVGIDPNGVDDIPFPVVHLPRLNDTTSLRNFYNAVELVAVPSLEETFSNTCLEALACGTPVAGFATGVLAEVLADGQLGACAEVGSIDGLSKAIENVVTRSFDRDVVAQAVVEKYEMDTIMDAYEAAFLDIMNSSANLEPLDEGKPYLLHDLTAQRAAIFVARTAAASAEAAAAEATAAEAAAAEAAVIAQGEALLLLKRAKKRGPVMKVLRRPSLLLGPLAPRWRRLRGRFH